MEDNKELMFQETLEDSVYNFGEGSQDGVKSSLRQCQEIFGCVSLGHQEQIAEAFKLEHKIVKTLIKLSPSLKESVVEYEVTCCTGARCAKNGSVEVLKTVTETLGLEFGETSQNGKIRLTTQNCFKKCGQGPNILVNGKFYHQMDREKSKSLMEDIKSK